MKWSFVPRDTGKPTYVAVNFDESEPGTCNNRELVEREPHPLLEGTAIAAHAIGCHTAFIYVRGRVPVAGHGPASARSPRPTPPGYLGAASWAATTTSTSCCTGAPAPTSAARRPRCSRLARGVPGPASAAAAVPGGRGPVRVADRDQQRRDADERAAHREQRRGLVQGGRHREVARHEDVHDQRQGRAARQLRAAARHAVPRAARGARRRACSTAGRSRRGRRGARRRRCSPPSTSTSASTSSRVAAAGSLLGTGAIMVMDETDCIVEAATPAGRVLRARVLRQVHAVPRGHLVGRARARPHRGRVRTPGGPAAHDARWARTSCSGRSAPSPTAPCRRSNRRLQHFMDEYEAHVRDGAAR